MHTSGRPRSAHNRCTCSHRGPVGSHATATCANPFARACAHRPVQRLTQPERLHPHRLTRQHPHIMINHRDRLLVLRQVDPDHRAIARQHLPQPLPARVPLPVSPGRAATLAHRTSSLVALGTLKPALSHQEDVPASTASRRTGASSALSYYYAVRALERFFAGHWDDAVAEIETGAGLAGVTGHSYSLCPQSQRGGADQAAP